MDLASLRELFALKAATQPDLHAQSPEAIADVLAAGGQALPAAPRWSGYPLEGHKAALFQSVMPATSVPPMIGAAPGDQNRWIIVSSDQLHYPVRHPARRFLEPLTRLLTPHLRFIREFTVVVPLVGHVHVAAAETGPYTLDIRFDAPGDLGQLRHQLQSHLDEARNAPKDLLRNPKKLRRLAKLARDLRGPLGALGRYHGDPPPHLQATTSALVHHQHHRPIFLLCAPDGTRLRIDLHSQDNMLPDARAEIVAQLIDAQILTVRPNRIARALERLASAEATDTTRWLRQHLERPGPPHALPPPIRDLAIGSDDPVIMHLFAQCSAFRAARLYHDLSALQSAWTVESPQARQRLLAQIAALAIPFFGSHPAADDWLREEGIQHSG